MTTDAAPDLAAQFAEPSRDDAPVITLPPTGDVILPGGYNPDPMDPTVVVYSAEVRELTGADEASIEKARRRGVTHFYNAILNAGTVRVGDQDASDAVLGGLLLGDRDALVLAIRIATYGPQIEFPGATCPGCRHEWDLSFDLDNVAMKRLTSPTDRIFEVPLRRAGKVDVRLPTGDDQAFAWAEDSDTAAEINSRLLSRCVLTVPSGPVSGNKAVVDNLSTVDRKTILAEIDNRQPGPQYSDAVLTHEDCGKEVPVTIQIGDLFPDL